MKWFILVMALVVTQLATSSGNDFSGNRIRRQFGALRPSLGGDANYDPIRDGNRNPGNNNNNNNNNNNRYPNRNNNNNNNNNNRYPNRNNNNNNNNRYPNRNNNNNNNNRYPYSGYPGIFGINCVYVGGDGYDPSRVRCSNNQTPGRGQRPPYRGRYNNNNNNRNNFNGNGYGTGVPGGTNNNNGVGVGYGRK